MRCHGYIPTKRFSSHAILDFYRGSIAHRCGELQGFLVNIKLNMASKGNAEVNYVHQNAILCETIKKEQRNHKLYTSYSINPFKKSKFGI